MAWLDKYPYLYNCAECGAKVKVTESEARRTCNHETAKINAPRRALVTGDGTLNGVRWKLRWEWRLRCLLSRVTGRCV